LKKVGQIILAKRCRFDLNLKNRKYFSQSCFSAMLRWSARTRESNSAKLVIDGGMLALEFGSQAASLLAFGPLLLPSHGAH
jgi:hypothetical protein